MQTVILKIGYVVILAATFIIRYPHEKRNRSNRIKSNDTGNLEKVLLRLVFLGCMLLPIIYIFTNILAFADYTLPIPLHILGLILVIPSTWLFYRSHKDLGRNWSASLEIREDHNIIDKGVYKYIRHPMYTSIWISVLAQPLLLPNYIAGLSGIISFALLYFLRVKNEEAMMKKEFGQDYEEYMQRTKRIIPFIL